MSRAIGSLKPDAPPRGSVTFLFRPSRAMERQRNEPGHLMKGDGMAAKIRLKPGDEAVVTAHGHPLYRGRGRVTWVGERSRCAIVQIDGRPETVYLMALAKVEGNRFTEALAYPQSAAPRATPPQPKKAYHCHLPLAALHDLEDE